SEEVARTRREQGRLQTQLRDIEQENQRYSAQYVEVERQNTNLANLYVASYRLHGTLDRDEVVTVVQEILANLVGSEESAIFEAAADGSTLALVAATGIDPGTCRSIAVGQGLIGRAVVSGEPWIRSAALPAEAQPYETELTACIPLLLDGRAIGAIALFRLLPQKSGVIEALDRELFELLATHAATALYCSARSRTEAGAGV
ncbi:MAG TPA: GAF domain-containing protein, partial [Vicinamibacteria bacterium]|nr:GAF domain-containing protein [Vicinamibacteria bacterium]